MAGKIQRITVVNIPPGSDEYGVVVRPIGGIGGGPITSPIGPNTQANSVSVTLATDEDPIPVVFGGVADVNIVGPIGPNLQVDSVSVTLATDEDPIDVQAVDLDIRDLAFATDKVDVSGSTLGANSGIDIGDVTINNGAGAAAVNIQDGGNSITVDGAVSVNNFPANQTVSGVVSTKTPLTPAAPTSVLIGLTNTPVLAADPTLKGLILVNVSNARISLGFGAPAVLDDGATLIPFGSFNMEEYDFNLGAINAIASAAASKLGVQKFTT